MIERLAHSVDLMFGRDIDTQPDHDKHNDEDDSKNPNLAGRKPSVQQIDPHIIDIQDSLKIFDSHLLGLILHGIAIFVIMIR